MKRGLLVISLFLLIGIFILSNGLVIAVHEPGHVENTVSVEGAAPSVEAPVSEDTPRQDILQEVIEEYKDAELVDAGTTPDSALYFIDNFFDNTFGDPLEVREEKVAEIEVMVEGGNIAAAREALENYEQYATELEKEIPPEQREEARESAAAIANTLEEIKDKIPEEDRKEFVDDVIEQEGNVLTAVEIADKISKLCGELVELGEFKKASEVCKLDKKGDEPKWLRGKKEGWNKQLEGDAQKFFEVLTQCMEITNNGIVGDYKECKCNEMPDAQAALCVEIAATEDACNDGNDESACGVSQSYIEEFMNSLPENLRVAVEKAMEEFGEEDFERHGAPSGCEGLDFKECMLQEAEKHLQYAPEECREPIREGIRVGKVRGERDARNICEKIMFEKNMPPECEGLDPEECAEQYGGPGRGIGGPGHGAVFQVCDNIKDSSARLACYDDNAHSADFAGEYYKEKREFREGEGFKNFDNREFDKRFRKDNVDKYADLYAARRKNYQKYYDEYNKEDQRRRVEETPEREEECVRQCASEGKAWSFINGNCECFGGDYERQFDQQYQQPQPGPGDYKGQECPLGQHLVVPDPTRPEGSYCVYDEQQQQSPTEPTPTGSSISGRAIYENEFLKYYFGY